MSGDRRVVVLVDHGSRRAEANAVAEEIASGLRARLGGARVEIAHLEVLPPSPGDVIDACAADAGEIVLLPLLLAPGRHGAADLERVAADAASRHPGLPVRCAAPIGAHPALLDALLDRLEGAIPGRLSGSGDPSRTA